jgi:indole-3-glycerol phosphate synthase
MSGVDGTYLERIVADVRRRLDESIAIAVEPPASAMARRPISLRGSIEQRRVAGELAVIGEVKRRSPSVGDIDVAVDPASQASSYASHGAAGISVLTERDHFGGSLDDLVAVRAAVAVPVLRKDFIVDERQLLEARAAGADAVLLIAAIHGDEDLARLVDAAHDLDLEVLLEVHDELELARAIKTDADVLGCNNRDLRSFVVDLAVSERLAPLAASDPRPFIAESGVRTVADAGRMRACGVDGLLVGEALMRAPHPGGLLRDLALAADIAGAST